MARKIEKGVALPSNSKRFGESRYPFGAMEVGDSFKVGEDSAIRTRNAAYLYGMRHGKKFSCRRVNLKEYRIWRTA